MKKVKCTLKDGEKILGNVTEVGYLISNGAWMLPPGMVSTPKQLEYLIDNRTPFRATHSSIDTDTPMDFGRVWQPDKEVICKLSSTELLIDEGVSMRRAMTEDQSKEVWFVKEHWYSAIKPWFPYWQGAKTPDGSECFYFSSGESEEARGKLMGLSEHSISKNTLDAMEVLINK